MKRAMLSGTNPPLLGAGTPLDEHLQVELLGGQALERVLADVAESAFVHVPQKPIFQIGIPELARVVVTQDALPRVRRATPHRPR